MRNHISSVWCVLGTNRPGFYFGTTLLTALNVLVWLCGIQTSLTLGPGGEFPSLRGNNICIAQLSSKHLYSLAKLKTYFLWNAQNYRPSILFYRSERRDGFLYFTYTVYCFSRMNCSVCIGWTFYAFSHEDLISLVCDIALLVWLGPCQEQRWGTVAFIALTLLSTVLLPPLYTLALFITDDETSRISGFSAVQLALFTAQSQQVKQRRLLGYVPIWLLPWMLLILHFFLLPGTPGMLHFCAICLGYNCIFFKY